MKQAGLLRRLKPLFYKDESLILSNGHKIFTYDKKNKKTSFLFSFQESIAIRFLNHFSLFFRLNRSGVYSGLHRNSESFFSYHKAIYVYDWNTKKIAKEFAFKKGSGPLKYTEIKDVPGFTDGIYFGEYFRNPSKEEIHIYQRKNSSWEIVYTFPKGEINHIHGLIPDPTNNCVWILGGDYGDSAGMWQATDQFRNVKQVSIGQQSRACIAFPVSAGLLYATDSQFEQNSIRILRKEDDEWKSSVIYEVNGSVIYGCELKDYYVFSTSTEPGKNNKGLIGSLLDNKPGPGIVKNQSDVILCKKEDLSCSILYSREKDFYPYRLFQFGAIMFPTGPHEDNELFGYNIGSKKNDLTTEHIVLDSSSNE